MKADTTRADVLRCMCGLSRKIINGATLEESLEHIFATFGGVIPYDRIGYAEVDLASQMVTARWMRSHTPTFLKGGFSAPLAGSSLSLVIERGVPRVMNDLPAYLERKPHSSSTRLIVQEGIKSSLTCPLYVRGQPTALLFFSSTKTDAYDMQHVNTLAEIANHIAMLLMTSQENSMAETEPPQLKSSEPQKAGQMTLGQLRPEMVLAEPLQTPEGRMLLGAGALISVERLHRIRRLCTQGVLKEDCTVVCTTGESAI